MSVNFIFSISAFKNSEHFLHEIIYDTFGLYITNFIQYRHILLTIVWFKDNDFYQKEEVVSWKFVLGIPFIALFVSQKITSWKRRIWSISVSFCTLDLWLSANTHGEWHLLYFRYSWNLVIKQLKILQTQYYYLVWCFACWALLLLLLFLLHFI